MSDVTPNERTPRLEAVNRIRSRLGEDAVAALPVDNDQATALIETVLDEATKEVCLERWRFNTEYAVELTANGSGQLEPGRSVLEVQPQYGGEDWVMRGDFIYDRATNSSTAFSGTYTVNILRGLTFVLCPEHVRTYIIVKAARIFTQRFEGETMFFQALVADERDARAQALRYEERTAGSDYNLLNRPRTIESLYYDRRHPYLS